MTDKRAASWANADDEPDQAMPLFAARDHAACPAPIDADKVPGLGEAIDRAAAWMRASEAAAGAWTLEQRSAVDLAIVSLARSREPFTADDVWSRCPEVPVTKGLASRLNAWARRGVIRTTGETRHAKRGGVHDHAQTLNVWIGIDAKEGA